MTSKPTILLASLGGTIVTATDEAGRHVVSAGATELLRSFPDLARVADIVPVEICRLPSHAITPTEQSLLVQAIKAAIADGIDAVVVTHGTDTIEETAYAVALQIPRGRPIALTGAMRSPDSPGADGAANLFGAFTVARAALARQLGPVVVVQDEIHLARWATKASTSRVAAFASPGVGPVGEIVEGVARIVLLPAAEDYLGTPDEMKKNVEIVWASAGAAGLLSVAAARSLDGLVVAGTGGGHMPDPMARACLEIVRTGLPVVLASRTGSGTVLQNTYGGSAGSESYLIESGVIPAGWLSPVKARLRLMTALALGMSPGQAFPV